MTSLLNSQKVLIFGFAREGLSTLNFLRNHGVKEKIYVADDKDFDDLTPQGKIAFESDKNIEFIKGSELDTNPNREFDAVFLTPGTPIKRLPNELWPIVTSQTQVFLEEYRNQCIGVTGTKGKSTTSSLIHEILINDGKKSVLLGNIGTPPLDFFDQITKDSIVVFELSSHQLSFVKTSPHIAVFLNIFPEHLDYYSSFSDYLLAKGNITKFQQKNDFLVINASPEFSEITKNTRAQVKPIVPLASAWETKLAGDFNQLNIAAAWEAAKLLDVSEKNAKQAVKEFQPLEHRLEVVGIFQNLMFVNDSISTVPESASAALNTFGDQVETLLIGGFDRGIKYTHLANRIEQSAVKNLIFFPTTGEKILGDIKSTQNFKILKTDKMEEAVKFAFQNTSPGKIVLLSPASPSFNLFKDYEDRGNQFKEWVVKLGKTS